MTINHKKINWTPSGVLSHFPSGDKGFQDFKKADYQFKIETLIFASQPLIKMERLSSGPSWSLLSQFPSGDKEITFNFTLKAAVNCTGKKYLNLKTRSQITSFYRELYTQISRNCSMHSNLVTLQHISRVQCLANHFKKN